MTLVFQSVYGSGGAEQQNMRKEIVFWEDHLQCPEYNLHITLNF